MRRYIPGLGAMARYRRSWLPADVVAGVVLADAARPAGHGLRRARRAAGDQRPLHVDPLPARRTPSSGRHASSCSARTPRSAR